MIKPDGVQRGLVGEIIKRFETKGYVLKGLKMLTASQAQMEEHYSDLKSKGFFPGLVAYMISGPVVAMVWEGKDAIAGGRRLLGATKPSDSAVGTIRGDFAIDVGRNICHGSDGPEGAAKEIAFWFPEGLNKWASHSHGWVYE
jgi:nucleoside-diphosphate kinase